MWQMQERGWEEAFRQFWINLQVEGVKNKHHLGEAIRRFSYCHERHRQEDKVIDLFIAAESLFMSDDKYIGELKYRLSERASLFIGGSDIAACRNIFRNMKVAYNLRSDIVHGNRVKEKTFR
jgi:Apea-like HEPN